MSYEDPTEVIIQSLEIQKPRGMDIQAQPDMRAPAE
jgi:hypothetical protein